MEGGMDKKKKGQKDKITKELEDQKNKGIKLREARGH